MMQIKKDTYNQLYDVSRLRKGLLNIGLCPGRGLDMFTAIYPELHRSMPTHHTASGNAGSPPAGCHCGRRSGCRLSGPFRSDWQKNQYEVLGSEELICIIPAVHPGGAKSAPPGRTPGHTGFKRDPLRALCTDDRNSTLRSLCDQIFAHSGFQPNVLFESNNTAGIVSLVKSTICCGIVPWYYTRIPSDELACFRRRDIPPGTLPSAIPPPAT